MRTLKLTLQYDGTGYVGWQRQASGVSIQGLLEEALARIEGAPVVVHGAGRTDAGVHAMGQVASLSLSAGLDLAALARALNAVLPPEVRIVSVEERPPDFHARFSAVAKTYEYRIVNATVVPPFLYRYICHVSQRLDMDALRAASGALRGTHDFSAFQGTGTDVHSAMRTIHRIDWDEGTGAERLIVLRIAGDGFLRHMVRNIAGTMIEVGTGRWPATRVAEILEARDRAQAGPTAPPQGLFLVSVDY